MLSGLVEDDDGESESEEEPAQRKDRPQHNRQRPGIVNFIKNSISEIQPVVNDILKARLKSIVKGRGVLLKTNLKYLIFAQITPSKI